MPLINDILKTIDLHGTVYFRANFHSPWGMKIPPNQNANFHYVVSGSCICEYQESDSIEPCEVNMGAGDLLIFPRGDSHTLKDSLESPVTEAQRLLQNPRESQPEMAFGGEGEMSTNMICGHFEYDQTLAHPLFDTLPAMLVIRQQQSTALAQMIIQFTDLMTNTDSTLDSTVTNKMAEALLIQALVTHFDHEPASSGYMNALRDNAISKVLSAIHQQPEKNWTLADMANMAAMSSSHFSSRFKSLVEVPPMIYLARWRMMKARSLLAEENQSVARVAESVGYTSEFAFSKAFKRITGLTPGEVRKHTRLH